MSDENMTEDDFEQILLAEFKPRLLKWETPEQNDGDQIYIQISSVVEIRVFEDFCDVKLSNRASFGTTDQDTITRLFDQFEIV